MTASSGTQTGRDRPMHAFIHAATVESVAEFYEDYTDPESVDALMQSDAGAVVIDFWGSSCGPCLAMAPDFATVAEHFDGDPVRFAKIQTDAYPELAEPFKIRSVPTLLFVRNGEILDAIVGKVDAQRLAKKTIWLLDKTEKRGIISRLLGR